MQKGDPRDSSLQVYLSVSLSLAVFLCVCVCMCVTNQMSTAQQGQLQPERSLCKSPLKGELIRGRRTKRNWVRPHSRPHKTNKLGVYTA